jgi:hypothetical protein
VKSAGGAGARLRAKGLKGGGKMAEQKRAETKGLSAGTTALRSKESDHYLMITSPTDTPEGQLMPKHCRNFLHQLVPKVNYKILKVLKQVDMRQSATL